MQQLGLALGPDGPDTGQPALARRFLQRVHAVDPVLVVQRGGGLGTQARNQQHLEDAVRYLGAHFLVLVHAALFDELAQQARDALADPADLGNLAALDQFGDVRGQRIDPPRRVAEGPHAERIRPANLQGVGKPLQQFGGRFIQHRVGLSGREGLPAL